MGLEFGNLAKIRGVVFFRLSPHEQKAFAGAISHGVPNMIRRFREKVLIVGPPFLIGYLTYSAVKERSIQLSRKNPKDYENDV